MGDIDQEMLVDIFTSWMSTIINTRGRHIAIDGKGVRAAALKVSGERTKYILNAIDAIGTTAPIISRIR